MKMGASGWTGGQYSLFRAALGLYLLVHFAQLIRWGGEVFSNAGVLPDASASPLVRLFPNVLAFWDSPPFVAVLLSAGVLLSALLVVGSYDRLAAVVIWYILACLTGRNPLIANPSLPFVGWLLLAHSCLPSAPYGSWTARSRSDPAGGWKMEPPLFAAAWVVMALAYSYSGYTKLVSPSWVDGTAMEHILQNPLAQPGILRHLVLSLPQESLRLGTWFALGLELFFAPLALLRRARPWLWALMLLLHLTLLVLIDFADLTFGMIILHLFTFNPAWVKAADGATEMLFYDGHCGLCQRLVRFVLAEDRTTKAFRFAPLQSEAFRSSIPPAQRATLPDSVVLRTANGSCLVQSAAILHILTRLGGAWRLLAVLASAVPPRLRDLLYDAVADVRLRLFRQPEGLCPLLPAGLRDRFDET